jgi:hypothetical protein
MYSAMTIKVRVWSKGKQMGFEVDIRFTYPDGTPFRQRIKAPVESKSAAKRWGEARERDLLMQPSPVVVQNQLLSHRQEARKEIPTLRDFGPRFIDGYARANKHKMSGVHAKERILENHLYPQLGDRRLDAIEDEDVQRLKATLAERSAKTVNNILLVLGKMLRVALTWKLIDRMPCGIELLKARKPTPTFYEFADYKRLVEAAKADARTHVPCWAATRAYGGARCSVFGGATSTSSGGNWSSFRACGRAKTGTTPRLESAGSRTCRRVDGDASCA